MAFAVVEPGGGRSAFFAALPEGSCSIAKGGMAMFHAADLSLVGIVDRAVVLADTGTLRIALRPAVDGEEAVTVPCRPVRRAGGKVDHRRREVNLSAAIRALGLTAKAAAGRYEVLTKGSLLIVGLTAAADGVGAAVDASRVK